MKTIITLAFISVLSVGCGKREVNKHYHLDNKEAMEEIADLKEEIRLLNQTLATNGDSVNALESMMVDVQTRLTELETAEDVVTIIDPCGDDVNNFDEVIFKLSSGQYVAYFEDGNNRFMSVLKENIGYRTTDKQQCFFRIENGQLID